MSVPEYLTVAEAAALLRVNHKTVRAEIKRGRLPALQVGNVLRVSRVALDERLAYSATPITSTDAGPRRSGSRATGHLARMARSAPPPKGV
jgi:excisionase family DNA binding protein